MEGEVLFQGELDPSRGQLRLIYRTKKGCALGK